MCPADVFIPTTRCACTRRSASTNSWPRCPRPTGGQSVWPDCPGLLACPQACYTPDHCGALTRQKCSPISLLAMALIEATILQKALVFVVPTLDSTINTGETYCRAKRDRACGHFAVTKTLHRPTSPFRGLL